MLVKAAAGLKVPKEDKPHDYIDDQAITPVPDESAYYARRVTDGDLVIATQDEFDQQQTAIAKADAAAARAAAKTAAGA